MNILVVGGGGREHAVVHKLSQSENVQKIYCAPGNAGIEALAECVNIKATDVCGMVAFAKDKKIDLVVVTPDDPLMLGMVDALENEGIRAFGPHKNAAKIEGSKVFAKELMKKYNIPTARYEVFDNPEKALQFIEEKGAPIVVKAEGLALGKGVFVARTVDEAKDAVKTIMKDRKFGDAGSRIVIEECMTGPEVSVLVFTDGKTICPMVSAQDHKRAYDFDEGPNTGGMGAFAKSMVYTKDIAQRCEKEIFLPTINAMREEGCPFKGVLYFGLMLTESGPKVVEYNARFGDPETQVVLPLLKTDLLDIFTAVIDERLESINIEWEDKACICVVLASGGYPLKHETGFEISGIESASDKDIMLYHAGTKRINGKYITAGGRVLNVCAKGNNIDEARNHAYNAVRKIGFKDMHFRKDIGIKNV